MRIILKSWQKRKGEIDIYNKSGVNQVIKDKMHCLSDFGICEWDDRNMKAKLVEVINNNPDKDPREVLDCYCRPMIQAVVFSWK